MPATQIKKIKIAGQTEVVDSLLKRVTLFNRETMQLLAAKNVKPDNSWAMYAPDQGNEKHLIIGLDEGANFNVAAFDRVSLATETYIFPPEDFEAVSSKANAFYIADVQCIDPDAIPSPVFLPGELIDSKTLTDVFFVEDRRFYGHFENGARDVIFVGAGTDNDNILEGTRINIGGFEYKIAVILNNGNGAGTVQLDWDISATKTDILEDGSCIFNAPMKMSYIETSGNGTLTPAGHGYLPFYSKNIINQSIFTGFLPADMKTLTFKVKTDTLAITSRIPILSIRDRFEIGIQGTARLLYFASATGGMGAFADHQTITLTAGVEYFICIQFGVSSTIVYSDNMTTLAKTLPVIPLSGAEEIYFYGPSQYANAVSSIDKRISIYDVRAFNKLLTVAERGTVKAAPIAGNGFPVKARACINIIKDGTDLSAMASEVIPYNSGFELFSPFYGTALNTLIFDKKVKLRHAPMSLLEVAKNIFSVTNSTELTAAIAAAQDNDVIKLAPVGYSVTHSITKKIIHLYGDIDNESPGRQALFNLSTTALNVDFKAYPATQKSQIAKKIQMFFCNLSFYQSHNAYSGIVLDADISSPLMEFVFVNSFISQGAVGGNGIGVGTAATSVLSVRMINCTMNIPNAIKWHFAGYNSPDASLSIEKCEFAQALKLTNIQTPVTADYVTAPTVGYGAIHQTDRQYSPAFFDIAPIYFEIPAGTTDEDLFKVQVPIDLSGHPEIFDSVTDISTMTVFFQDGSILPIEVESWDVVLKKGLLWVSLPYVLSGSSTFYAIVYPRSAGQTGGIENDLIHAVWDDFLFSYHMGYNPDGAGSCKDSSGKENHGDPQSMTPANKSFGPLGGYEYSFNGSTQFIDSGKIIPAKIQEGAVEIVFKTSQAQAHILSQAADGWNDRDVNISIGKPTGVSNSVTDGHLSFEAKGPELSETNNVISTLPVNDGSYHHAGLSWYKENLGLVIDGVIDVPQIEYKMWGADGSSNVMAGTDGVDYFAGAISEIIFSNKFRSAYWHELFNKSLGNSLLAYIPEVEPIYQGALWALWGLWGSDAHFASSNGNKTIKKVLSNLSYSILANVSKNTGKWYFEIKINAIPVNQYIGVATLAANPTAAGSAFMWYLCYNGHVYHANTGKACSAAFVAGDVIGVAVDIGTGKIWWSRNGTWQLSGNPATGVNPVYTNVTGDLYPSISHYTLNSENTIQTGADASYALPEGFEYWGIKTAVPFGEGFVSEKKLTNFPVKIDLPFGTLAADQILASHANLSVLHNGNPIKAEVVHWAQNSRAILWALIPEVVVGNNIFTLSYGGAPSGLTGTIGSSPGEDVWEDFKAVYHLSQSPAAIKDSTGNNPDAIAINMDGSNLVDFELNFNGTDEAINFGNLFPEEQESGQVHIAFKTEDISAPLLSQGSSEFSIDADGILDIIGEQAEESVAAINDNGLKTVSYAFHRGKRDYYINGVDQIPYGIFGSDGLADVLIGGHYAAGATFAGNIVDMRFSEVDKGQQELAMRGKLWKETLDPNSSFKDVIPVFSFDQKETYKIWTGSEWRAVVSKSDAVHGVSGDSSWHYRDDASIWSKIDAANFDEAAKKATEYLNNQNATETIETLTSVEWASAGGMSSDGYFDMAFVFNIPVVGLCPSLSGVHADGMKQTLTNWFDLGPFNGKITGSKVEWSILMADLAFDYSVVKAYSCITGGTWAECTRNGTISGISAGMVTTGLSIQFKLLTPFNIPSGSKIVLTPKIF